MSLASMVPAEQVEPEAALQLGGGAQGDEDVVVVLGVALAVGEQLGRPAVARGRRRRTRVCVACGLGRVACGRVACGRARLPLGRVGEQCGQLGQAVAPLEPVGHVALLGQIGQLEHADALGALAAARLGGVLHVGPPRAVVVGQKDELRHLGQDARVVRQPLGLLDVVAGALDVGGGDEAELGEVVGVLLALADVHLLGGQHLGQVVQDAGDALDPGAAVGLVQREALLLAVLAGLVAALEVGGAAVGVAVGVGGDEAAALRRGGAPGLDVAEALELGEHVRALAPGLAGGDDGELVARDQPQRGVLVAAAAAVAGDGALAHPAFAAAAGAAEGGGDAFGCGGVVAVGGRHGHTALPLGGVDQLGEQPDGPRPGLGPRAARGGVLAVHDPEQGGAVAVDDERDDFLVIDAGQIGAEVDALGGLAGDVGDVRHQAAVSGGPGGGGQVVANC
jgi:hypothetical protein